MIKMQLMPLIKVFQLVAMSSGCKLLIPVSVGANIGMASAKLGVYNGKAGIMHI
jgi:hypothetical protein